jgi:acylpyruvate hydrolase
MRLVSFYMGTEIRLGALLRDRIIDLNLAHGAYLAQKKGRFVFERALQEMPPDMVSFLELGDSGHDRVRDILDQIESARELRDPLGRRISYPEKTVRLAAPVPRPPKIIVVGLNYLEHITESQVNVPDWPWTFSKPSTVMIGPGDPIGRPPLSEHLDGEVELAIIVGRRGKYIPVEKVLDYVAGYSIFNDLTIRNIQFDGQPGLRSFYLGKSFQDSAALGPSLITTDEVPDPHNLDMLMYYNDQLIRKGNTKHYVFGVEDLISFYSRFFTLEPGDVIAAGCPSAIKKSNHHVFFDEGYSFLNPGDRCICKIEGFGILENPIVDATAGKSSIVSGRERLDENVQAGED